MSEHTEDWLLVLIETLVILSAILLIVFVVGLQCPVGGACYS